MNSRAPILSCQRRLHAHNKGPPGAMPGPHNKWSILLMVTLSRKTNYRARFSELQRSVDGISQRMLTTTLRQLERDGLVYREVFPEVPPRVEYELSEPGLSLLEPMRSLVHWIGSNWELIKKARNGFDNRTR